ncbi:uncharacterized protein LOC119732780 [Patiria miniata]|uniref:Reverse transcriptase domain-containing protein n=1 Tax=Patiria miniata TaxID=46514 RepID=A0A914AG16_PATMI|nr:uncharacterized protein LOC119732780 [Patiria miniata]
MLRVRLGKEADKIVDIIEANYAQSEANLDGTPSPVPIHCGVRQEAAESMQQAEHAARGEAVTTVITYADDILMLGQTREELQGMMNVIYLTFKNYGLTMAGDKTVSMSWNTPEETRNSKSLITVGGEDLGNVRTFKYLGHVLADDPNKPQHITQKISSARAKWAEI